jgi:exonuclease SbcD
MKLLHTSDWHLGRSLYNKKRYEESDAFLGWLTEFITNEKIDALLVAGDIFDTTTPSNRAQELYYRFLGQIAHTGCRHVVITGGNHDSSTFLEAPKNILSSLDIHVVGAKSEFTKDEVILLNKRDGLPEAIICAVPFLRDRDVRIAEAGESPDDKTKKLLQGIAYHYKEVADLAQKFQNVDNPVPIIGMGHLFTRNARTSEGDGVRELYIGTIAHVDGDSISEGFDYMALGHLHLAQTVGNSEKIRYSGSPIPMGFAEADHTKKVVVVNFENQTSTITEHSVPVFQQLLRISGDLDTVSGRINELKEEGSDAWLEIEITVQTSAINITSHFDDLLKGSDLEILRIKNKTIVDRALTPLTENESLETLDDSAVFIRCLDAFEIKEEERPILLETYKEALLSMHNADPNVQ